MLAIFDFDSALLSVNTLEVWREHHPRCHLSMAREQSAEWWSHMFGGICRLRELKSMLSTLNALGVEASICTNNRSAVVGEALRKVGLEKYFYDVEGNHRVCDVEEGQALGLVKHGNVSKKGLRVKMMLALANVRARDAVFVDGSKELCDDVGHSNADITTLHCKTGGLQAADMQFIVNRFLAIDLRRNKAGRSMSGSGYRRKIGYTCDQPDGDLKIAADVLQLTTILMSISELQQDTFVDQCGAWKREEARVLKGYWGDGQKGKSAAKGSHLGDVWMGKGMYKGQGKGKSKEWSMSKGWGKGKGKGKYAGQGKGAAQSVLITGSCSPGDF